MYSTKMRRIQIYLDPKMDTRLHHLAAKTGKPKAQLIREGVNLLLEQEARHTPDSLLDLVGIGGMAGYPDASERHDDYLYVQERQPENEEKEP